MLKTKQLVIMLISVTTMAIAGGKNIDRDEITPPKPEGGSSGT